MEANSKKVEALKDHKKRLNTTDICKRGVDAIKTQRDRGNR